MIKLKMSVAIKRIFFIPLFVLFFSCIENLDENPSIFTVTAIPSTSSIKLDWEESTSPNELSITYDVFVGGVLVVEDLNVLTYTITGLEPGVEYVVKVVANDEDGNKREVENTFATIVNPVPTQVTITEKDVTSSGFTIDWTAATIEGDEGVKYDVVLNGDVEKSDLEVLTYTFTNLVASTSYNVKVTAKSNEFSTTSTQEISVTTIGGANNPAPTQVTITQKDVTSSGFTIDWTAATIEGDEGVKYDVVLNDVVKESNLEVLTYTFTGLVASTSYNVKVTAKSNEFSTTSTQEISVTTIGGANNPAPTQVTITQKDVTSSGFTIDWTAATIEGDEGVKYDVVLNGDVEKSDLEVLTYTFTGLVASTSYNVKVTAKSNEFSTTSTQEISVTTIGGANNPAPTQVTITEKDVTSSGFTIDWTAATIEGDEGVKYDVVLNGDVEKSDLEVLTYTFTGLVASTLYNVKVTAKSNEFSTTSTQEISVTTIGANNPAPTQVTITEKDVTSSGFTIDWTAATIEGDEGVKYDVVLNGDVEKSDLEVLTYTFTGLVESTSYNVKVTAKSNEFSTISTQEINVTTKGIIWMTDIGKMTATVNWSSWTNINTNDLGAYKMYIFTNDGTGFGDFSEFTSGLGVTSDVNSQGIMGLSSNTKYEVRVEIRKDGAVVEERKTTFTTL